ncbi:uncharacterized protein LOC143446709 [Clavelina lepadiformis]|uniref:uncharacterized protein LOC143446709 n=1 Tax=Clavelina lepadiformis TaxID=159417 RepID=UPI004042F4AD
MYYDLLQSNQFSEPTTTMKAQAKASAQNVTQTLIRTYCEAMDASNQSYRSKSALDDQHEQEKEKALSEFRRLFTSPYTDLVSEYKDVLFREIEKEKKNQEQNRHFKRWLLERNRCNGLVDEGLQLYKDNRKHDKETARQNALTLFDRQTSEDLDFKDVYKAELEKKIDAYEKFKDEEDRLKQEIGELSEVCHEALAIFKDDINKLKGKYVPHEQLAENHNQCRNKALKYFQERANQKGYDQKIVGCRKNQLNKRLQSFYPHLLRENEELLKKIKDGFEIHKEKLKQQHLDYMNKVTENKYVLPKTLRAIHEKFIKKVAEEHKTWEETPLHEELKENVIEVLEESYIRLAEEMERRKGLYRKASHRFVLMMAGWTLASVTIAALAIGVAIVLLPIEISAGVVAGIVVGAITLLGFIK